MASKCLCRFLVRYGITLFSNFELFCQYLFKISKFRILYQKNIFSLFANSNVETVKNISIAYKYFKFESSSYYSPEAKKKYIFKNLQNNNFSRACVPVLL